MTKMCFHDSASRGGVKHFVNDFNGHTPTAGEEPKHYFRFKNGLSVFHDSIPCGVWLFLYYLASCGFQLTGPSIWNSLLVLDLSTPTPPSNPISKLTRSVLQAFLAPNNTIHALLIHIYMLILAPKLFYITLHLGNLRCIPPSIILIQSDRMCR